MTDNAELLPCGHCDGEAWLIQSAASQRVGVSCRACGATGGLRDTDAEAIAAWNTRATVPASPPVAEEGKVEQAAWAWMDTKFAMPEDYDYSADEMVDAFIAGRSAALSKPRVSREEIARVIAGFGPPSANCGPATRSLWEDALAKADAIIALIGGGE